MTATSHQVRRRAGTLCALVVTAAILGGEAWCVVERRAAAKESERILRHRRIELLGLQGRPELSRESVEAAEAKVAAAQDTLRTMQAALSGGAAAAALKQLAPPASRADAFFDLASLVERLRERARELGVEVRPEAARFGFATHANGGPDEPLIESVFRQRQIVEHLVESLFAARPNVLLAVKRERPTLGSEASPARGAIRDRASEAADFFVSEKVASVRGADAVKTTAFQIGFIGQTATLRAFLDRLARFDLPLVVRAIEVTPADVAGARGERSETSRGSKSVAASYVLTEGTSAQAVGVGESELNDPGVPLVPKRFSRFTVTIEYVRLLDEADDVEKDGAVSPVAAWSAPVAQPRGPEWLYEVFTPPEIFYYPRTGRFAVQAPAVGGEEVPAPESFGLELIAVRHEPFRLQLMGYVGDEGRWRGTFQDAESGEIFLAGAGRELPGLDVTIARFDVRRQAVAWPESMTTQQRVATALVRDHRAGRDIALTHGEREPGERCLAIIETAANVAREIREGEECANGDVTYRIERIRTSPAGIDVVKRCGDGRDPERRSLTPRTAMQEMPQ